MEKATGYKRLGKSRKNLDYPKMMKEHINDIVNERERITMCVCLCVFDCVCDSLYVCMYVFVWG